MSWCFSEVHFTVTTPTRGKSEPNFTIKGLSTKHSGAGNLFSLHPSISMCLDPHGAGIKPITIVFLLLLCIRKECCLLSSPLTSGVPMSVAWDRVSVCAVKMAHIKKSFYFSAQLQNSHFQKYQRIKWQERCDGCDIACLNVRDRVGIMTSSPSDKVWVLIWTGFLFTSTSNVTCI